MARDDGLAKIEGLAAALEDADAIVRMSSRAMAEATIGLIQDGFRSESDPYGVPWQKKQASDGRKTLSGPTGRLKVGWHVERTDEDGFNVAPAVDYAAPHQNPKRSRITGKLKRPRRMMVPDSSKGLPEEWASELEDAAEAAFEASFKTAFKSGPSMFAALFKRKGGGGGGRKVNPIERLRRRINIMAKVRQKVLSQTKHRG